MNVGEGAGGFDIAIVGWDELSLKRTIYCGGIRDRMYDWEQRRQMRIVV